MRNTKRRLELMEFLEEGIKTTAEIIDIATSGYNESYKKMRRKISGTSAVYESKKEKIRKEKQTVYSTLSELKKQGLVEKNTNGWTLTKLGNKKKSFLRARFGKNNYEEKKIDGVVIVIFDVPEKERWKRDWLRSALNNMGFELLQGSVWIGSKKISSNFLGDLKLLNIAPYVEIFSVNKKGTLEKKI
jgi:DNA-binding transcriptional regulator PaaX